MFDHFVGLALKGLTKKLKVIDMISGEPQTISLAEAMFEKIKNANTAPERFQTISYLSASES